MHKDIIYSRGYGVFVQSFLAVITAPGYPTWHDASEEINDETIAYFLGRLDTQRTRSALKYAKCIIQGVAKHNSPGSVTLAAFELAADKVLRALDSVAKNPTGLSVETVLRQHDAKVNVVDAVLLPKKPPGRVFELPRADKPRLDKLRA